MCKQSIFALRKITEGWAEWLEQCDFTHLVTIAFCPSEDFSVYCDDPTAHQRVPRQTEIAKEYLRRVGHRVFKRGRLKGHRLCYVGFPELQTRHGDPTHFHFHILVWVPADYETKFDKYIESEWRKALSREPGLRRGGTSLDVRKITHLGGAIRYVTKFAHTELPIIADLPDGAIVCGHRELN
jgi:hypothetical protein